MRLPFSVVLIAAVIATLPIATAFAQPTSGNAQPRLISKTEPAYTEEARRAEINSSVLLRSTVTADGVPQDIQVVRGAGFGLDESAKAALSTWRFEPGTKQGRPVATFTTVDVNFRLLNNKHEGQNVRLNFTLPAEASRPELIAGKAPANSPMLADDQLRMSLSVSADGSPRDWLVLETTSRQWSEEVMRQISDWRFRPAKVGDQPIEVKGVLEINWTSGSVRPASRTPMIPINSSDAVDSSLSAPGLVSPRDGATFDSFPRSTTFQWEASPGAASYILESDYSFNGVWSWDAEHRPGLGFPVKGTTFSFDFVGAQPGRWRVWPVNADGQRGTPSEWRTFRYTR